MEEDRTMATDEDQTPEIFEAKVIAQGKSTVEQSSVENKLRNEMEEGNLELREAFNLFDKDGNGCITVSELKFLLSSLGYNMTEAELMDMMNKIDADGNGAIDFPEFLELTSKKLYVASDEDLARETFQVIDRDHKGHITVNDIRHILEVLEQNLKETDIEDMVHEADFDNDGVVNLPDFLKMLDIKEGER